MDKEEDWWEVLKRYPNKEYEKEEDWWEVLKRYN